MAKRQTIYEHWFLRFLGLWLGTSALFPIAFSADDNGAIKVLDSVTVESSRTSQIGISDAASQGYITQKQLEARTVYRSGELLEATPGLIISQHSGEGKANQFYLRGINLDHGTDLRTTVDGMLVNIRSHSHGQGWTDLNFLIPEITSGLQYRKGPYYADEGDFASAGAVSVMFTDQLEQGIASAGIGQNGYKRLLLADSPQVGNGNLLYALELYKNDVVNEHELNKIIEMCQKMFYREHEVPIDIVKTGHLMYDLNYKGIELGSYGTRKYKDINWVFGTGLAEPRLSKVLKIQ